MSKVAQRAGRIFVLFLLLLTTAFVGRAGAVHVECGQVITKNGADIVLDRDVGPCVTDGLIIRASNVTVNLNGFDIFGDDNTETPNIGVRIEGTNNRVVDTSPRQDGEVRDFNAGILIEGGSSNEVCRTTVRRNVGIGIFAFSPVGDGIVIHDSNSNVVVNNTVDLNGPFSGITLLGDSDGNKIGTSVSPGNPDVDGASMRTTCDGGNSVQNNRTTVFPGDIGIRIESEGGVDPQHPNSNDIENNLVTGNELDGISHFFPAPTYTGSTSNNIRSNTITGNGFHTSPVRKGDGIRLNANPRLREVGANNTVVEDNVIADNAGNGITINSQLNNIKHNRVTGNGAGVVGLDQSSTEVEQGHGIVLRNDQNVVNNFNEIRGNYSDGINLTNSATKNEIKQNTITDHPKGDGIDAELGALANNIMNNTALGNGLLGGFDLSDDNPNADPAPTCETNTWQSNQEVTKNQPCID